METHVSTIPRDLTPDSPTSCTTYKGLLPADHLPGVFLPFPTKNQNTFSNASVTQLEAI